MKLTNQAGTRGLSGNALGKTMDSVTEGGAATGALILGGDEEPTGGGTLTGGLGGAAGGRVDRVKLKSFKLGLYPITDS